MMNVDNGDEQTDELQIQAQQPSKKLKSETDQENMETQPDNMEQETQPDNMIVKTLENEDPFRLHPSNKLLLARELGSRDPVSVISEFQKNNSLSTPNATEMCKFLDLLGVTRQQAHQSLLDNFITKALSSLASNPNEEFQKQALEYWFPYLQIPQLRPIPLRILNQLMPNIPQMYLDALAKVPEILEQLPLQIRQLVWRRFPHLFESFVLRHAESFISDAQRVSLYSHLHRRDLPELIPFGRPADRRKDDPILSVLLQSIGESYELYSSAVSVLCRLYVSSRNPLVCVLRSDLLMVMHDNSIMSILDKDECYKSFWCLDACIRENGMDSRRTEELKMLYLRLKEQKNPQIAGDLSMGLSHPFVQNILFKDLMYALVQASADEIVPRASEKVRFLIALLSLASGSLRIVRDSKAKFPKAGSGIFEVMRILQGVLASDTTNNFEALLKSVNECKSHLCTSLLVHFTYYQIVERGIQPLDVMSLFSQTIQGDEQDDEESLLKMSSAPLSSGYRLCFSLCVEIIHSNHSVKVLETILDRLLLPLSEKYGWARINVLSLCKTILGSDSSNQSMWKNVLSRLKDSQNQCQYSSSTQSQCNDLLCSLWDKYMKEDTILDNKTEAEEVFQEQQEEPETETEKE